MHSSHIRSFSVCTLLAVAGLASSAHAIDWALPVDGDWNNAANWSPADIPNSALDDAALGLIGPYTVSVANAFNFGSLSITNPEAVASFGSVIVSMNGDLFTDGTVILNDNGNTFNSGIRFAQSSLVSGSGSIFLNGPGQFNDASIGTSSSADTMTIAAGALIHGNGQIVSTVLNAGTILADTAGGDGLQIAGDLTNIGAGTLVADSGIIQLASGSTVTNGAFSSMNDGYLRVHDGTATINGITNNGDLRIYGSGDTLAMTGSATNNGTITMNPELAVFNAHLRFDADATLGGNGTVLMQSAGDPNDAQINAVDGFTGTIGSNQSVEGSGWIDGAGTAGLIHNNGTINGNDPLNPLVLYGNHTGTGTYRADDGVLGLGSGLIMNGGTFDSSGSGSVNTFSGTSVLSNMVNNGNMGMLGSGHFIVLEGPLTNNGTITMNLNEEVFNAEVQFNANTSINGTGTITMLTSGNINDSQITANDGFTGTIGVNQTIEGGGWIDGQGTGVIHNAGTINGNNATEPLVLYGNHTGTGTYRADDGVLGLGSGLIMNGGTFDSSGSGSVNTFSGTSVLSNMINNGQMGILGNGHFIVLEGPLTNNGDIAINTNDDIFNAHLEANIDTTISGNGTITMNATQDTGDARLVANDTFTMTLGSGQIVQGSGWINGNGSGIIHNNGVFIGNDPDFPLEMRGNHTATGIYRGDNGVLGLVSGSILNGGTFETVGTGSIEALSGTSVISNVVNNGSLGIRGSGTFLQMLTDLTNNGTISINSNDDIFNAHLESGADVAINGNGSINLTAVQDTGDARLRANSFTLTVGSGQTISGAGSLQGTMIVNGTIDPSGTLIREFTIDEMTLAPSSEFIADLGGPNAGEFDRMLLGGNDTIDLGDASLTVNLDSGYFPVFGQTWDIIDGGTITGAFDSITLPAAPPAQIYRAIQESDRVFVALTCKADFTGDLFLDIFDVILFVELFNANSLEVDFTGNGIVDIFDVLQFIEFFNGGCTGIE